MEKTLWDKWSSKGWLLLIAVIILLAFICSITSCTTPKKGCYEYKSSTIVLNPPDGFGMEDRMYFDQTSGVVKCGPCKVTDSLITKFYTDRIIYYWR